VTESRRTFDPHRVRVRVLAATVAGLLGGISAWKQGSTFALLVGWNAASLAMLVLAWIMIAEASPEETRKRAGSEDPGRTLVYVIVLLASSVSLLAAVVLSRDAKTLPAEVAHRLSPLCLATVAVAWGLTHTAFTLRYARLYYRADAEGVGGVEFPDKLSPSYFDFAYFAFTIGMCFQTSDVCIASPQIRRTVLLHALIAFTYNTAILAFVLNLVFGSA
jgi:uncharacterized membrane protein